MNLLIYKIQHERTFENMYAKYNNK